MSLVEVQNLEGRKEPQLLFGRVFSIPNLVCNLQRVGGSGAGWVWGLRGPHILRPLILFWLTPSFRITFYSHVWDICWPLPLCQIWNLLTAGESYSDTSIFPVCGYFNFQASFCQHAQWKRRQKLAWYKRNHMQGRRKNVNMVLQQSWYPMSIFCADVKYRNPQKDVNPPG